MQTIHPGFTLATNTYTKFQLTMKVRHKNSTRTLILMSDDRSPFSASLHRAPFYSLAAALNCEYANRHAYDFLYCWLKPDLESVEQTQSAAHAPSSALTRSLPAFTSYWLEVLSAKLNYSGAPSSLLRIWNYGSRALNRRVVDRISPPLETAPQCRQTGCTHPLYGPRAAAWAKLLCIEYALGTLGYERVVYVDSDAFFSEPGVSIDQFLERQSYRGESLVLTFNYPWTRELDPRGGRDASSGFMVWHSQTPALQILSDWWNCNGGVFNLQHDWEQSALQEAVLPKHAREILITEEITFQEQRGQFLRHVGSAERALRQARLRLATAQRKWTNKRWLQHSLSLQKMHVLHFGTKNRSIDEAINANGSKLLNSR